MGPVPCHLRPPRPKRQRAASSSTVSSTSRCLLTLGRVRIGHEYSPAGFCSRLCLLGFLGVGEVEEELALKNLTYRPHDPNVKYVTE